MHESLTSRKKLILAMCICMVSMATHNAILKNGVYYKIIHISVASQSRLQNLVSNKTLGLGLSSHGQIYKLSNLHIYEY